jgi:NTP-dependent ternary system trypsin peptidase co-occuring protein
VVLRFELGPVGMEFLLEVKKDVGGQAGVKFGVISVGQGQHIFGIDASSEVVLDAKRRTRAVPLMSDEE